MADLIHELVIRPAYDKRPKYGQHCVDMCFYVKGDLGAVQFLLYTGWYSDVIATPEKSWQELMVRRDRSTSDISEPMPADLGYHSPTPRYEDQGKMDCSLLPQGFCYYDGSGLNANRMFSILVHQGGDALWAALEDYYHETFTKTSVTAAIGGE